MNERELLDRIKRLVAELCELDAAEIADDGRLLGYGVDSVRALDLFFAFEDEFGLEIDEQDPELAGVKSVRDLGDLVARRLAIGRAAD